MENRTEQINDLVLENELVRNRRVVEHPILGRIVLSRPTPRMEALIAEERRKQYHKDLRNPDILSRDEIEKEAIRRGIWSKDLNDKLSQLSVRVGELMGVLDKIGYRSLDTLAEEYDETVKNLLDQFEEGSEAKDAVRRYFNLDAQRNTSDRVLITKAAQSTLVDELLEKGETLRIQIELLADLAKVRKELLELQQKQARLFADSIEARADRAEELARIYYCCRKEDGDPLWPKFEDIWDADPEIIEFLVVEMFNFTHGITDEYREILERHGFLPRMVDTVASSEGSPDHPQSNSDGEPLERTQPDSLESGTPTT